MAAKSKPAKEASIHRIDAKTQNRLEYLMARSNEDEMTDGERSELERFAVELDALSIKNTKTLAQRARPEQLQRKNSPAD